MTVQPIQETDYYGKGFTQAKLKKEMKGPRVMNFGASRTDADRMSKAREVTSRADVDVPVPESRAWSMRPRDKSREIGPSMKFANHFQVERLMSTLKANPQTHFTTNEVIQGTTNKPVDIERALKHYLRTGQYSIPDTEGKNPEESVSGGNMLGMAGFEKLRKEAE